LPKRAALFRAVEADRTHEWTNSARAIFLTITIYGIPNCDTMKKARAWLESHGVAYVFHDYRKQGLEPEQLDGWVEKLGWEVLLNKAGTTFRKLLDADKENLDAGKAKALMLAHPTMIKRPVLDLGGRLLVGFKPEVYAEALGE
jgi:arsenate reductase